MFRFLRSLFATQKEPKEAFHARMAELQQDFDDLERKSPSEVEGGPMAATYYGLKVSSALKRGDDAEARRCLLKWMEASPCDGTVRLAASMGYVQLGDETEAMAQLGIALGVDPANYAVHRAMAARLLKRGERQAAEAVLELGWRYARRARLVGMTSREEYFSVLRETPPAD